MISRFRLKEGAKMKIEKVIRTWAQNRGYHVAAGDVSLLEKVRHSLKRRRDMGEIEADFFQNYLDNFTYLEACSLKNLKSVLVVAIPRPAHILPFSIEGKTVETILPPTYVRYRKIFAEVRGDLEKAVSGNKCHLEILNAPLKALANELGLLSYGRNNIGYIDGLGSYFQLVGLVADKRIENTINPRGPAQLLLPRCQDCRVCVMACPMGAIDSGRILIHAEKCYTLFSEAMEPIPEDLKAPSSKCLIGCLRCQQVCPENRGLLRFEKAAVSFTPEETEAFLGFNRRSSRVLKRAREKLLKLELTENYPVFARNLKRMLKLRRIAIPSKSPNHRDSVRLLP